LIQSAQQCFVDHAGGRLHCEQMLFEGFKLGTIGGTGEKLF
jgi:hypothetical protein